MRISTLEFVENAEGHDLIEYWHPPPCSLNRVAASKASRARSKRGLRWLKLRLVRIAGPGNRGVANFWGGNTMRASVASFVRNWKSLDVLDIILLLAMIASSSQLIFRR
jgi:hypothetical protein